MQQFIDKLKSKLEEKENKYQDLADSSNFDGWAQEETKYLAKVEVCEELLDIVNQLAEEYKLQNVDQDFMQDLMVAESLSSVLPMQPFEVEALDRVIERAKYSGGWIPCEVRLPEQPEENPDFDNKPLELYLVCVPEEKYSFRAFWNGKFFSDGWDKVDAVAWMPLPLLPVPYQSEM